MRLSEAETKAIREEVLGVDPEAVIYLFGSRVDDAAWGGDIDILVVSDRLGFREKLKLQAAILDRIGWQQFDLVIRRHDQASEPFAALARETGVRL